MTWFIKILTRFLKILTVFIKILTWFLVLHVAFDIFGWCFRCFPMFGREECEGWTRWEETYRKNRKAKVNSCFSVDFTIFAWNYVKLTPLEDEDKSNRDSGNVADIGWMQRWKTTRKIVNKKEKWLQYSRVFRKQKTAITS